MEKEFKDYKEKQRYFREKEKQVKIFYSSGKVKNEKYGIDLKGIPYVKEKKEKK